MSVVPRKMVFDEEGIVIDLVQFSPSFELVVRRTPCIAIDIYIYD